MTRPIDRYHNVSDSEDEFESGRDEINLDNKYDSRKENDYWSATDEEVLKIDATSSDEDEENKDSASENLNSLEDNSEDEVDLQNWGKSKKNYYDADLLSEEEDIIEEEKEALRLQKLYLSKLKKEDFIDDLEDWEEKEINEKEIHQSEIVTEELLLDIPDNLSNEEAINYLKKIYPEFPSLAKEYCHLFPQLDPLKISYEKATGSQSKILELRFFALSAYLGVLAMYFSIIVDPDKDVVSMKDHPIMISIMRCKQLWKKVKNIDSDIVEIDIRKQPEESDTIKNDLNIKVDNKKKEKKRTKDIKQKIKEHPDPIYDDLNILNVEKSFQSMKNVFEKLKNDNDYEDYLDINNPNSTAKKRSLKFYTTQINQKTAKRSKFSNSGDADLPYQEHRKENIRSIKETEARIENEDNISSKFEPESDLQSNDSDENYYNMLSNSTKKRKLEGKIAHDMEKELRKQSMYNTEDEIVDGKRKIRYDIEKNKGIIPYRPKEVRNPRVKKRKKYEAAKKKLASKIPIYKGPPKDVYKGEATGIKTHLVKSTYMMININIGKKHFLMLFHGGYSVHEIVSLMKSIDQEVKIPIDVILEVILSLIIFCIERVFFAEKLQPISYSGYMSYKEESGDPIQNVLDYRPGFIDIRQKRRKYKTLKEKQA
ncbi:hypothetical protein MERGE_002820 [Pneumocystis wakefieldiae]|uniref:Sas10 C-terminal domain-containing protein n=1 Tax=Pneumocystis wakefieldiae TaxID=38082 RepID=A0A899GAA2_9ASCO|nr:hypothetical protein MERGE_002820 [Pneumocystis wakefieldiae]